MAVLSTFNIYLSIIAIFIVIFLLIKQQETRTVLIGTGVILCILALQPMAALDAFAKAMTSAGLITAICSSMGFAFVMKYTQCDMHLVKALTTPMQRLGFLLIPITTLLTFFINIAIPSAAGCAAAVGATLIPILINSGVRPAMAGAAVFSGTFGSMLSPGSAHNSFVAELTQLSVPEVIKSHFVFTLMCGVIAALSLIVATVIFRDYQNKTSKLSDTTSEQEGNAQKNFSVKPLFALAPLVPLVLLLLGASNSVTAHASLAWLKMGVPQAMIIGAIYAILVTRTTPSKITDEFFNGMGSAYAQILGIIIAASVFVAGLTATGAIDAAINFLKDSNHFVRFGATLGPFLMAIITGSGDAAAMAFNGAVTPHADALGYEPVRLGMGAALSGALGRTMSPIAGAAIVCAGLAQISPIEIVKRTALGMILSLLFLMFFML